MNEYFKLVSKVESLRHKYNDLVRRYYKAISRLDHIECMKVKLEMDILEREISTLSKSLEI